MSEIQKRKKGQVLNTSERQLVLNLMNYLKDKNSKKSISEVIKEISKATGFSERTIYKIKKDASKGIVAAKTQPRVRKKENKNSRNVKYDSFIKSTIRKKVHHYLSQNIPPTLNLILSTVNDDPSIPLFKRSTLHTLLQEIGYVYEQKGKKAVLTEKVDVVSCRQQFLRDLRQFRSENRWIIYTGETVISLMKKEETKNSNCKIEFPTQDLMMPCTTLVSHSSQMLTSSSSHLSNEISSGAEISKFKTELVENTYTNCFTLLNQAELTSSSDFTNKVFQYSIGLDMSPATIVRNSTELALGGLTTPIQGIECDTDGIPIHTLLSNGTCMLNELVEPKPEPQTYFDGNEEIKGVFTTNESKMFNGNDDIKPFDDVKCNLLKDEMKFTFPADDLKPFIATDDIKNLNNREFRFSVMHAACDSGFIQGAENILLLNKKTEECDGFKNWFAEKLIPKVLPNSVIILDDTAAYHKKMEKNVPDETWKKQQIKNWLLSRNINCSGLNKKKELMAIVNNMKQDNSTRHKLIEMAKQRGIIILSLPPCHYELNPLNMIWAQVKQHLVTHVKHFKIKEIRQLVRDGFTQISQNNWINYICQVRQMEDLLLAVNDLEGNKQEINSDVKQNVENSVFFTKNIIFNHI